MNKGKSVCLFLLFLLSWNLTFAQKAIIRGKVSDFRKNTLVAVNVSVLGLPGGTITNEEGKYQLEIPADTSITVAFSFIGYQTEKVVLYLHSAEEKNLNVLMKPAANELSITIEEEAHRTSTLTRIDPKTISYLPNASGNIETILKTLPGVVSNNELSSQYSVRGGNYDENLVYVNDVEIYRPFLIRSGQQEGLSFVNPDLTSSLLFSAGGFDARYGDKMSSVLDVSYKRPNKFGGSASASLLGSSLSLEGSNKNHRLTYLFGARQKSTQYLLNALETKGEYRPSFTDVQTYITYDITPEWEINFLGNFARNKYTVIPESRETVFGTVSQALALKIYFDGQEMDQYDTYMGAFSGIYKPNERLKLKFISSTYKSYESETFDIQGQYWINLLDKDLGSKKLGDSLYNIGVGTFLPHARNKLEAWVSNFEHKGFYSFQKHNYQWGGRIQHEEIIDKMNEWKYVDSAGFSLPVSNSGPIILQDVYNTHVILSSNRYSGYVQDKWLLNDSLKMHFTYGLRASYWDVNKQFIVSPRMSYSIKPRWNHDWLFRAATGVYYQPPFYRELRNLQGEINKNIKAQQSVHFVLGSDFNFKAWGRKFKLVSEAYYKHLNHLVPYKIDNVRIRYYGQNEARGYATGLDFRLNGEFVNGIESWASLSILKTQEDIVGDYYISKTGQKVEPGYIPRPTDQRVTAGLFFQDYLPKNPTYKVHLNFVFGTGLPYGPPKVQRYADTLRIPPYRRVDVGFSKEILKETDTAKPSYFKYLKSIWLSAEVFNLFQVDNTVSFIWVSDVNGTQYAVPNYLTKRLINVRLIVKF